MARWHWAFFQNTKLGVSLLNSYMKADDLLAREKLTSKKSQVVFRLNTVKTPIKALTEEEAVRKAHKKYLIKLVAKVKRALEVKH